MSSRSGRDVDAASMTERQRGLLMIEAVSDRCGDAVTVRNGKWVFAEWWTGGTAPRGADNDEPA